MAAADACSQTQKHQQRSEWRECRCQSPSCYCMQAAKDQTMSFIWAPGSAKALLRTQAVPARPCRPAAGKSPTRSILSLPSVYTMPGPPQAATRGILGRRSCRHAHALTLAALSEPAIDLETCEQRFCRYCRQSTESYLRAELNEALAATPASLPVSGESRPSRRFTTTAMRRRHLLFEKRRRR